jgi:hypothetical protein
MLKSTMEEQNNNTGPQQDIQDTNPPSPTPADPPIVTVQPAQPIEKTAPVNNINLPAAPQVSVGGAASGNQSNATPNPAATSITSDWPGAFKIYKTSKAAVQFNLSTMLGLIAINIGLFIIYFIALAVTRHSISKYIVRLIVDIINFMLYGAIAYTCLQGVKNTKTTVSEALSVAFKKWLYIAITSIIVTIILLVSLILFVVPFFFVAPRLTFAIYNIINLNMDPIKAVQTSWEQTRGNVGKIYGIIGVFILIVLPSITIIGIVATLYLGLMYYASYAILYMYILNKQSGTHLATPPSASAPSINPAPSAP